MNGDILLDSHEFTKDEYGGKITFMRESNKQNSLLQEEELFSLAKQIKQGFSEPLSESVLSSRENSAVLEYAWMLGKCNEEWSNVVFKARQKFSFNTKAGEPSLRCGVNLNAKRLFRELKR